MLNRRDFLKTASAVGGLGLTGRINALDSRQQDSSGFFGVHSFIESHPDAVFIMKTDVDVKTNSPAKLSAGLDFARSVFIPKAEEDGGVPLTHNIGIKPNLTARGKWQKEGYTFEGTMGIVTDPIFVEGVIEGMKELGLSGSQFYLREVNGVSDDVAPYIDSNDPTYDPDCRFYAVCERTGAEIRNFPKINSVSADDVVWKDIPEGVWFKKIPYFWPLNSEDSFMLNIAKFKTHGMGVTLCLKNLQGTNINPYQQHCGTPGESKNLQTSRSTDIYANYKRHKADGIPRWNVGSSMEYWATRCLDNNSVTKPQLHIVEGVYGRDGAGFTYGPDPNGLATDYMTNIIIFGKNPVYTDIIGHWLAGHEPGNFGLFHMAIERGLATELNPKNIPVYEWHEDGSVTLTPLTDFERTPLLTNYLKLDGEDYYHLVNEPFDYPAPTAVSETQRPNAFVLSQNHPNPFNPYTSIEYTLPGNGYARLEVYNSSGQLIDVLVDGNHRAGAHMAVWNTNTHASGIYFYRFRFGSFSETKKMMLMK